MPDELIHKMKTKSLWSGRVTSVCGQTWEPATYETSTFRLLPFKGPRCPGCYPPNKRNK